ncbi:MAG TPA: hypothetical protein ENN30_01055 [Candidatus Woesearchaeota archaeon]|nr:hypothetical protein [Candidatus Woesearchaeota archaeon]
MTETDDIYNLIDLADLVIRDISERYKVPFRSSAKNLVNCKRSQKCGIYIPEGVDEILFDERTDDNTRMEYLMKVARAVSRHVYNSAYSEIHGGVPDEHVSEMISVMDRFFFLRNACSGKYGGDSGRNVRKPIGFIKNHVKKSLKSDLENQVCPLAEAYVYYTVHLDGPEQQKELHIFYTETNEKQMRRVQKIMKTYC